MINIDILDYILYTLYHTYWYLMVFICIICIYINIYNYMLIVSCIVLWLNAPDRVLTCRMEPWEVGYGLRVEIASPAWSAWNAWNAVVRERSA